MKRIQKLVFLSAFLVLAGCQQDNQEASDTSSSNQETTELHLSVPAELPTMDPALVQDAISFTAINQVMEGLYRLDKEEKPVPALSDGDATISADGLTYTFKLKPNLKWSNGTALTAKDFEFGWKRVVNPKTAANYAFVMKPVKNAAAIMNGTAPVDSLGIKALDDSTLEVQLEKPTANFLSGITRGTFFPQNEDFVTKQGEKFGTDSEHTLYNGPFTLSEWDGTGLSWTYNKNPDYWDQKNVALAKITNEVTKETATGINLYQDDKLDLVRLTGEYAKQYLADPEFIAPLTARSVYLEINQTNIPALKNEKIREALALTINRNELVNEIISNGSEALDGLVTKNLAKNPKTGEDFRKESGEYLTYNKKKAKQLWAEAKKETGIKEVEIELVTDDDETSKKVSQFIQSSVENELDGVKIKLKNVPFKNRIELGDSGQFGLLLSGWGADENDPDAFLNLFLSDSVFNGGKYANPKYDEAVKTAVTTANEEEKYQADLTAEKIILEDAGIIPLYQKADSMLVKNYVKDYIQYQIGSPNYKYITIDKN